MEEQENKNKKKKIFSWQALSIVLFVLLIVALFTNGFGVKKVLIKLPADKIAEEAVQFINENLLQPGSTVSLVEADCQEKVSLCKFKVQVGENTFDSYVSSNGEILFPDAIDVAEFKAQAAQAVDTQTPAEIPQTEKPSVELFVMSYCPFGLQAQKTLLPVMELLKDKADIKIRFVDYIMHDKDEIDENLRQYCIQKEQAEKYIEYLNCFAADGDYQGCLSKSGVNQTQLNTCVTAVDKEYHIYSDYEDESTWLRGTYPVFKVEGDLNDKYGVQGSPTMVVNGVVASPDRTPQGYKEIICQGFNVLPDECAETLSTAAPTTMFGLGETDSSSSGVCE